MTAATTSPLFAGLSIEDAEPPQSRTSLQGDPIFEAMKASALGKGATKDDGRWKGQSKRIEIPAKAAPELEKLVRKSAEELGCGSSIRFRTKKGDKAVEIVSVGGKKDEKTGRMGGGKPEVRADGEKLRDAEVVVAWFWAKSPNQRKARANAVANPAAAAAAAASRPVTDSPQA